MSLFAGKTLVVAVLVILVLALILILVLILIVVLILVVLILVVVLAVLAIIHFLPHIPPQTRLEHRRLPSFWLIVTGSSMAKRTKKYTYFYSTLVLI